jgi:DNA-binding CsgD family transcriptional regulator
MRFVLNGQSSKEIARVLGISALTVSKHRENMRRKLGIKTVAQLAAAELAISKLHEGQIIEAAG